MKFDRGEVILINLGSVPNEVKGHEQANYRPCIIVRDIPELQLLVIVPLTSKEKSFFYTSVEITKGIANLEKTSYVLCHQIRTVSYERVVGKKIGVLPEIYLFQILTVLADLLDLP